MMPKISVRPDASRNSSSPYCTAFRHWTRKVAISTAGSGAQRPVRSELAAAGRVGERLHRHADLLVLLAVDPAQVDVLHRVVGLRQRERPARRIDLRLLDRGGELGSFS